MFSELNDRSRTILKAVVEAYMSSGTPVGSRAVAEMAGMNLSPATIRSVMADLEKTGLLHAPHTSAGRLPTENGLRFFVDGLLEVGDLGKEEKRNLEVECAAQGHDLTNILSRATDALSGLSSCAGLVIAPKINRPLKQIEFVPLAPGRVLVVLVTTDGLVENRVIDAPLGLDASTLSLANSYLNRRLAGKDLTAAKNEIEKDIKTQRAEVDDLTSKLIEAGLAVWSGGSRAQLLLRGQTHLLEDVSALEDLERVRQLLESLETEETMAGLLEATSQGEGVQIFIGAQNNLFTPAGCSMIVAPYQNAEEQIIGAIGVIGPVRMNYARIIPMVDYTSKLVGKLVK